MVKELKSLAKKKGIKGYYLMKKAKPIEALGITEQPTVKHYYCIHEKLKYFCKDCGGSQICSRNKRKQQCKLCKDSDICKHNRYEYKQPLVY